MERGYVFYCQLDYADRPYPCTTTGQGTLADNGCGPCAASMVVENLLNRPFPPWEAAALAIACGARDQPGTDFYRFAPVLASHQGLHVRVTEDADEVCRFLKDQKGMVIANTRGDRAEDGYIGVFSDSGHYIVLTDLEKDQVRVLDPMYRPGRFDKPGRKGKVTMEGNEALASFDVIRQDCHERPFFLFQKATF